MIVVPDDKRAEALANSKPPSDDPPPSYTQEQETAQKGAPSSSSTPPPVLASKSGVLERRPSNYVLERRSNGPIKGTWAIDPFLQIPPSLLPALPAGESEATRRNFDVESSNGNINVDVYIVTSATKAEDRNKEVRGKRATLRCASSNGSISIKTHAPPHPRPSFHLAVHSSNGSVNIHLPRSFHGPLTIVTFNGSTKLSTALTDSPDFATLANAQKSRKCFLGDYSGWDNGAWAGDELVVEAKNGSVKLQFDDEGTAGGEGTGGFFGRLFGF